MENSQICKRQVGKLRRTYEKSAGLIKAQILPLWAKEQCRPLLIDRYQESSLLICQIINPTLTTPPDLVKFHILFPGLASTNNIFPLVMFQKIHFFIYYYHTHIAKDEYGLLFLIHIYRKKYITGIYIFK